MGSILPPISRVSKITLPLQEHFVCIMALSNDLSTELIDLKQQYPRDITPVKGKGFYSHSCYKLNKLMHHSHRSLVTRGFHWSSELRSLSLFVNRGIITELKQQRRWRLWKRRFKSEFSLLSTLSRLFHLVQFVKCWQMFVEIEF